MGDTRRGSRVVSNSKQPEFMGFDETRRGSRVVSNSKQPEVMVSDDTRRGSRVVSNSKQPEFMGSDDTRRGSRVRSNSRQPLEDDVPELMLPIETRRDSRMVRGSVDFVLPTDSMGESEPVKGFSEPRTTRLSVSRHNENVDPQSSRESAQE